MIINSIMATLHHLFAFTVIRLFLWLEGAGIVLILFAAPAMARGIGI